MILRLLTFAAVLMMGIPCVYGGQADDAAACQMRMKDFVVPGAPHEFLKSFEGTWTGNILFRATPEESFGESQLSVDSRMIMGGRYLERNLKDNAGEFEIRIVTGYDKLRKEYTIVWIDNACTGMITSTGQYDSQTKTLSEKGNMSCPMTNQPYRRFRATTKIIDADHHTYEMFKRDDEGDEFKAMTIEYSKVK